MNSTLFERKLQLVFEADGEGKVKYYNFGSVSHTVDNNSLYEFAMLIKSIVKYNNLLKVIVYDYNLLEQGEDIEFEYKEATLSDNSVLITNDNSTILFSYKK